MSTAEPVALQSMFEGLFVRALKVDGAFKDKLRAKGYDVDRPRTRYPMAVWLDCVDVAALEVFPGLARPQAWVQLGRRFIDGYFETLVGRMIGVTLPFLSPKTFVGRVPRFVTTGLEGEVSLTWEDEKTATLRILKCGELSGSLMAGIVAVCFERMGSPGVKLEPRAIVPLDSELRITLP